MDDYLVCFPMKAEWVRHQPPTVGIFPAPLVTSRDGQEPAEPDPISDLQAYAVAAGWRTQARYSEGWVPHGITGKPLGPKKIWSVRLSRGGDYAVAVREGDVWKTFWVVKDKLQRFTTLGPFMEAIV